MSENLETELLNNQPQEIYKYAHLDDRGVGHLKDVLVNNRLKCSSPSTFNDPFDVRPFQAFDTKEFKERYFQYFRILAKQKHENLSPAEVEDLIERMYRGFHEHSPPISRLHDLVRKCGVCCLTETGNNLLMWAHYTRGHNGYCLKFNAPNWHMNGRVISYKVEYLDEYPTVDFLAPYFENLKPEQERDYRVHFNFTKSALLRKSPHWVYEQEWRIILPDPGYVTFDPANLTQIIFGVAVDKNIIEEIRQLALKRQTPIEILKAELDKNTFSINYVPI